MKVNFLIIFLKKGIQCISHQLVSLFYQSLFTSQYPKNLKNFVVIPIYESGS